jgi:hypothetical protein
MENEVGDCKRRNRARGKKPDETKERMKRVVHKEKEKRAIRKKTKKEE